MKKLIDADKVYDDLVKKLRFLMYDGTDVCALETYVEVCCTIHEVLLEQPAAYDVDAVVEQLEKLKEIEFNRESECDENGFGDGEQIFKDGENSGRYAAFVKAIKIVKENVVE